MEKIDTSKTQVSEFKDQVTALAVDQKMDELLALLESSDMDSKSVGKLQERFNKAVEKSLSSAEKFKAFKELDDEISSRLEMADNLEDLLSKYQVDSEVSQKYLNGERISRIVLMVVSCLLITLGFSLIVLPATPEFEMFTIFHFTRDDGFTLMDLIALLIVFAGVYLFIRSVVNSRRPD